MLALIFARLFGIPTRGTLNFQVNIQRTWNTSATVTRTLTAGVK